MSYQYSYVNPRRASDDDETEEIKFPFVDVDKKPYRCYEQTYTAQHVHFYISKSIGDPDNYTDMIHRIAAAGPQDVIFIHLNTHGGNIETGIQLINAMQNSQAKIVTILESVAYSLGTLIFLAGDEMVVNDHCLMMFHNFNAGLVGKGNELVSELAATVEWFGSIARDIYIPFLTEDELARMIRGEDFWIKSPEIRERLQRMIEHINAKAEAEEQAAAQAEAVEKFVEAAVKKTKAKTKNTDPK